jgi:hypothetical protein
MQNAGTGVLLREPPATSATGTPDSQPSSQQTSRPARQHHPHMSGLYYIPYGAARAAGRTVRAVNEMLGSRDKEES